MKSAFLCHIDKILKTSAGLLGLLLLSLSLISCQTAPPQVEPEASVWPDAEEDIAATPAEDLEPSERVRRAIEALQVGDQKTARNQLTWALADKPTLRIAKRLLEQLDADPEEYLGGDFIIYEVQSGDSLSLIAKKFTDDSLKFVILARYNDIENPSLLKAGQKIKVPDGKRSSVPQKVQINGAAIEKAVTAEEIPEKPIENAPTEANGSGMDLEISAPESIPVLPTPAVQEETAAVQHAEPQDKGTIDDTLSAATLMYESNDLPGAIALLEGVANISSESKETRDLLLKSYRRYAQQQESEGNFEAARSALEKAVILEPSNEDIINDLILVEDRMEAERLYANGTDLAKSGQLEAAYKLFSQALTYDPEYASARQAQLRVRNTLTDNYHRQAMLLFRRHQLDEAIVYWDKILAIDPDHSLAPGYKARALELKRQLQKIDQE